MRQTARAQRQRTSLPFAPRPAQPRRARAPVLSARTRFACVDARHEFSSAAHCAAWRARAAAGVHGSWAQSCEAKTAESDLRARAHSLQALFWLFATCPGDTDPQRRVFWHTRAAHPWGKRCAPSHLRNAACARRSVASRVSRASRISGPSLSLPRGYCWERTLKNTLDNMRSHETCAVRVPTPRAYPSPTHRSASASATSSPVSPSPSSHPRRRNPSHRSPPSAAPPPRPRCSHHPTPGTPPQPPLQTRAATHGRAGIFTTAD